MERLLNTVYPPLEARSQLPPWYLAACMTLTISPFIVQQSRIGLAINSLLLCVLWLRYFCYTTGDAVSDYYNSGPVIALFPWYIDFVLCTPRQGAYAPVFNALNGPQSLQSLQTTFQRLKWSIRLMLPAQRGIGWNWQVKGVPKDPWSSFSKTKCIAMHIAWAVCHYGQSTLMLVMLGWSVSYADQTNNPIIRSIAQGATGWAGAIWTWNRLCCAYNVAAAVCIASSICDSWEWPPLMGPLHDAWSVRQMWSAVYHQALRRMLSRPAMQMTRLLGMRKGSLLSGTSQLIISFGLSCVFHQLQMYNARRTFSGELAFFMSQPVAILAEDLAQYLYRPWNSQRYHHYTKLAGYAWVIVWFALSLPPYVKGLLSAGVVKDWILADGPFAFGSSLSSV